MYDAKLDVGDVRVCGCNGLQMLDGESDTQSVERVQQQSVLR